jgi:hypothetical protein
LSVGVGRVWRVASRSQLRFVPTSRIQKRSAPPVGCLHLQIIFQSLTYSAVYTTALLVLPAEVAQPLVPVETLTRSSSPSNMLPEAISEALGIDLSEVVRATLLT